MLLRVKSETSPESAPGGENLNIGSPMKRRKDEKPLSSGWCSSQYLRLAGCGCDGVNRGAALIQTLPHALEMES
jgi:hypothetical protein